MDENSEVHWPEEVVQMIVARIPFPQFFKVPAISRGWNSVFSAMNGSNSFQAEVSSVSTRWPRYCPVFGTYRDFWAFDRSSKIWLRVNIPNAFSLPAEWFRFVRLSGPLVCLVGQAMDDIDLTVVVLNVITSAYQRLPVLEGADWDPQFTALAFRRSASLIRFDLPLSREEQPHPYDVVFCSDSRGYQVFLLFEFVGDSYAETEEPLKGSLIYSYKSRTGSWERLWTTDHRTSQRSTNGIHSGSTAYTGRELCCLCMEPNHVWIYTLPGECDDVIWMPYQLSERLELEEVTGWGVVACEAPGLVLATLHKGKNHPSDKEICSVARVYELHPVTLKCTELASTSLPFTMRRARIMSDGNLIFFCPEYIKNASNVSILCFDLDTKTWDHIIPRRLTRTNASVFSFLVLFTPVHIHSQNREL